MLMPSTGLKWSKCRFSRVKAGLGVLDALGDFQTLCLRRRPLPASLTRSLKILKCSHGSSSSLGHSDARLSTTRSTPTAHLPCLFIQVLANLPILLNTSKRSLSIFPYLPVGSQRTLSPDSAADQIIISMCGSPPPESWSTSSRIRNGFSRTSPPTSARGISGCFWISVSIPRRTCTRRVRG